MDALTEISRLSEAAFGKAHLRDPRVVISLTRGHSRLRQFMQHLGADRGVNKVTYTVFDRDPLEVPLIPPVEVDRPSPFAPHRPPALDRRPGR